MSTVADWKKTAKRNVERLSPCEAKATLARITADTTKGGATIFHADIRALTGGFNSQAINFHVIRLLWERGKKASHKCAA